MAGATFSTVLVSDQLDNMINGGLRRAANQIVGTFAVLVLDIAQGIVPVDTGRLQASLERGADENIFILDPERILAIIGTKVFYAVFVEYGTRFHDPQPFLIPALELVRPDFEQAMAKVFNLAKTA